MVNILKSEKGVLPVLTYIRETMSFTTILRVIQKVMKGFLN